MSTVDEIEVAIQKLSREEFAALRNWIADYDAAEWDAQFERDVADGKLEGLAAEALTELREGRCTEL